MRDHSTANICSM